MVPSDASRQPAGWAGSFSVAEALPESALVSEASSGAWLPVGAQPMSDQRVGGGVMA